MRTLILLAFLSLSAPLAADTTSEIKTALDYYAQVWNENDIEAIEGYYHSEFVLVTKDGTVSRQQQLDGIRSIGSNGGDRGELSHSDVNVKELGDGHAMAWGKITLKFKDASSIDSWFTTVYAKTPFGWKALLTRN
jgi:ketosteroid isomerase-like protein